MVYNTYMEDIKKYINKWVVYSTENGQILESDKSFEKLYSKLDEKRKDLVIRYFNDPKATLSP